MWLKGACIFLMVTGFGSCAFFLYVAYVEGNMIYPNGGMTAEETTTADAAIDRTVRYKRRLALLGATVGGCAAFTLGATRRRREMK